MNFTKYVQIHYPCEGKHGTFQLLRIRGTILIFDMLPDLCYVT